MRHTYSQVQTVDSDLFGKIQPIKVESKSDQELKMKLLYPYAADTENDFFLHYFLGADPITFELPVRTCRYIRTPVFKLYPDLQWAVHVNYSADKILYYKGEEVELISMKRDIYDYIKPVIKFLYERVMKPIEELVNAYYYLSGKDKKEFKFLGKDLQGVVDKFLETDDETINLGYHQKGGDKLINYAKIPPHSYILYYMAFQMSLATLALDLLILYFVTGRMKLRQLKSAKNLNEAFKKINDNNISFIYPKISCNFGFEYEQMEDGEIAPVYRFTLQAKPFVGVKVEHEVEPLKDKEFGTKKRKLPDSVSLKAGFSLKFEAEADINVKFNLKTREWSLNENATDQKRALHKVKQLKTLSLKNGIKFVAAPDEVKNSEAFIEGDMIRTDAKFVANAFIKGELSLKYHLIPIEVEASLSGTAYSFIGFERMIGFDKHHGPFTQERIYFSGLQFSINTKSKVNIFGYEPPWLNKEKKSEGNLIAPSDLASNRIFFMKLFK